MVSSIDGKYVQPHYCPVLSLIVTYADRLAIGKQSWFRSQSMSSLLLFLTVIRADVLAIVWHMRNGTLKSKGQKIMLWRSRRSLHRYHFPILF